MVSLQSPGAWKPRADLINCFLGMVDWRKVFNLISSRDHFQRSSPSRISYTLWAGFEPAQHLISGLVEWSWYNHYTIASWNRTKTSNGYYSQCSEQGVMACTCIPTTLETEFRNGVGSIPFGSSSPSIDGWIVWQPVTQHKERSLSKY